MSGCLNGLDYSGGSSEPTVVAAAAVVGFVLEISLPTFLGFGICSNANHRIQPHKPKQHLPASDILGMSSQPSAVIA